MLGYQYAQATVQSQFGSVPSTFAMDNVQCTGNEASLLDCPHLTVDNCSSHKGAGVICTDSGWLQLKSHSGGKALKFRGTVQFLAYSLM